MTDLFRPKRSDPPAVRLLKAIFTVDEKRERVTADPHDAAAEQSTSKECSDTATMRGRLRPS
jgi:hypothetical protein